MFEPKTNRLVYGDLLAPPPGYSLGLAVCTTYSLDLETLIASLVAIGLNEATDTELLKSPVNTLHAIERVSKKIVVFCESGQTRIPEVSSPLHLLLEKMIVPVALPAVNGKNNYPSFHPKTWVIRYESRTEKPLYRFIVMSRNLTFDRSWDVSIALEGREEAGGKRKVQPLLSFLSFLRDRVNSHDPDKGQKRAIVDGMISSLQGVRFHASENGRPFRDFEILPLGIGDGAHDITSDELFIDKPGHGIHDMLIMSPFVSKGVIQKLDSDVKWLQRSNRRILITRMSELPKLKGYLKHTDVYVMKDAVVEGENELEDNDGIPTSLQDIHAKLYLRVKDSNVSLYLGSMNASERGLGVNVEMMLRLETTPYYLNKESLSKAIMGEDEKANPFKQVFPDTIPEEETEATNPNEGAFKRLCHLRLSGEIAQAGDGYDVTISCTSGHIPERVTISPLRAKGLTMTLDKTISFTGLRLMELSEFYIASIGEGKEKIQGLIFIPTKGIPQDREKGIISGIINDPKKFAEYVAFVLGDSSEQVLSEMMESEEAGNGPSDSAQSHPLTALYERMLRVACEEPERLKDIQRLVRLIDNEEIITPEFKKMYGTFMSALRYKYDG